MAVPTVLFLCVHNAGRSQMALGWFDHLTAGRAVGLTGGSEPAGQGLDSVRPIRDEIERRVRLLIAELGVDPVEAGLDLRPGSKA